MVKAMVWLAIVAVGLYLMHRLALWLESRGHIYYINTEPSRNTLGNALLEAQSLIEPGKRALAETIREERPDETTAGDPPSDGEDHLPEAEEGLP